MKKKIIAVALLAVAGIMSTEAKVRYRGFVEVPFGVSACSDEFGGSVDFCPNFGISTNHGVCFNEWYTGLGIEASFPETSLFARCRYDFPKLTKRWRPYAQADAGLLLGTWYADGCLGGSLRLGAGFNLRAGSPIFVND